MTPDTLRSPPHGSTPTLPRSTPLTPPPRRWSLADADVPTDPDLRGSEEEVVAPRLAAHLHRPSVPAPATPLAPLWRTVLPWALVAGVVGLGSLVASALVVFAALAGWVAKATMG